MNTNYLAALGTGPTFLFVSNEMPYAELPYIFKIVNHTHTILSSVAIIQMGQFITRKAVATEAVLNSGFHNIRTVLDTARDAGLRFQTVATSAAGACFSISYICTTEAAVHSAGSDQRRANRICLCRSFLHHVSVLGRLMWVPQF